MINIKYATAVLTVLFCVAGTAGYAEDNAVAAVQPDNTQVNTRDQNENELTADQQADDEADRAMTKEIRQSIMRDKSLSSYAHNIKIISQAGMVTLKGPVRSSREKRSILKKALAVTGSSKKITDQISIKR